MKDKTSQNNLPPARNKVTESVTLDLELGEWLREYAHRTRVKKQHVLRQALTEFRERVEGLDRKSTGPLPTTKQPSKHR